MAIIGTKFSQNSFFPRFFPIRVYARTTLASVRYNFGRVGALPIKLVESDQPVSKTIPLTPCLLEKTMTLITKSKINELRVAHNLLLERIEQLEKVIDGKGKMKIKMAESINLGKQPTKLWSLSVEVVYEDQQ